MQGDTGAASETLLLERNARGEGHMCGCDSPAASPRQRAERRCVPCTKLQTLVSCSGCLAAATLVPWPQLMLHSHHQRHRRQPYHQHYQRHQHHQRQRLHCQRWRRRSARGQAAAPSSTSPSSSASRQLPSLPAAAAAAAARPPPSAAQTIGWARRRALQCTPPRRLMAAPASPALHASAVPPVASKVCSSPSRGGHGDGRRARRPVGQRARPSAETARCTLVGARCAHRCPRRPHAALQGCCGPFRSGHRCVHDRQPPWRAAVRPPR